MIDEGMQERYLRRAEEENGKRIYGLLCMLEQDSVYDFGETSPYSESILSLEVKKYFEGMVLSGRQTGVPDQMDMASVKLQQLFALFQLDAFEQMCVELAILGEVNPNFEKFYIYMNNDWNNGYIALDTAIRLYTQSSESSIHFYRYFTGGRKLMKYFLCLHEQEGKSRARWGLKCRQGLFRLLFCPCGELFDDCAFVKWYSPQSGGEGEGIDWPVFSLLDTVLRQSPSAIYLYGKTEMEKVRLLQDYGREKGKAICVLDIRQMAALMEKKQSEEWIGDICRDIFLAVAAKEAWLCIHFLNREFLEKELNQHLFFELLESFSDKGVVLFATGEKVFPVMERCPGIWEISVEEKAYAPDVSVWERIAARYPVENRQQFAFFAEAYRFTPPQIERIMQHAEKMRLMKGLSTIGRGLMKEACIREAGGESNHLITMRNTGYQWEDLVLPKRQKEQLRNACNRILYRRQVYDTWEFGQKVCYGRGVSMVFSGPPGTGKTMSAGIVAEFLGAALMQVDLSAVVSKYIGETEKNLNMVFDTAMQGQGVLFFDEADVLFSRRTQVNDSNDKHSNMEAAYLLQKMEEYEGVVILATNYIQNMDEAFKRRIPFMIEFPFPDETGRRMLWEKVFPQKIEFDGIPDYDFLARHFELTGSHIKNIALQAAFLAADKGQGVSMEHIIKALLLEMRKTGKRISREDLREYYIYYE